MDPLTELIDSVAALPTPLMLAAGAAFSFAESGLGVGMVVPGETAVLFLSAAVGPVPLLGALFLVVALAGSAGDHVGFLLGRHYGRGMRGTRVVRRLGTENWDRAMAYIHRRGAWAVFVSRMLPLVRTLTPAAAGVGGVPYRRFLPASLAGAVLWSAVYCGIGAAAGESVREVEQHLGRASWAVFGALALAIGIALLVRRRRASAHAGPPAG